MLVPLLLAGPLLSLGMAFVNQATELASHLQKQPLRLDSGLLGQLERYPLIGSLAEWLRQHLTATTEQLQDWMVNIGQMLIQAVAEGGGDFIMSALGSVIHFFMMLFLLFFLLRDGPQLLDHMVRLVPMDPARRRELFTLIGATTRAVVFGTVMTAIGQGALVGIGFAIAGIPSSVVFGVLAGFLALLPVGGAALVWVPAMAYLALTSEWGWAMFMLIWGAVVSLSDNWVRPLLISSQAPVSIPIVFVGVIGGISAFGFIGVIIGPLLLTIIGTLLRFLDEKLAKDRH
jgi:predicted PurR-regulated permease PerM